MADRNERFFDPIVAARTSSPFGFDPLPVAPRRSSYYVAEDDPTSASFLNADAPFTRVDPETGKELVYETSSDPYSTADVLHGPTARAAERARDFEPPLQPIFSADPHGATLGDKFGVSTALSKLMPWAVDPDHLDKAANTPWPEAAKNSLRNIDPIANTVNLLSLGAAGLKHGSTGAMVAGMLAPSTAAGYGAAASGLGRAALGKAAVPHEAGSLNVFLSPNQLGRAEKAGHIGKGAWGSTEALAEATALAKRLPPPDSNEFAPFVRDAWRRTGWDVGDSRIGHPVTELDSSKVVLNRDAIDAGRKIVGAPYTFPDGSVFTPYGWSGKQPLGELLNNIGPDTPLGDALPFLRDIPTTWTMDAMENQPGMARGEYRALGPPSIEGSATGLGNLQKLLRHEGLGHGAQAEHLAANGKPLLLSPSRVDVPTDTIVSSEIRKKLAEAKGRPDAERALIKRLVEATDHARYLSTPHETLARLSEPNAPVDVFTPPSQRNSFTGSTLAGSEPYVMPATPRR